MRELRCLKGMTQKDFAKELNVSGNTIHCRETDKQEPSMYMLIVISNFSMFRLIIFSAKPIIKKIANILIFFIGQN